MVLVPADLCGHTDTQSHSHLYMHPHPGPQRYYRCDLAQLHTEVGLGHRTFHVHDVRTILPEPPSVAVVVAPLPTSVAVGLEPKRSPLPPPDGAVPKWGPQPGETPEVRWLSATRPGHCGTTTTADTGANCEVASRGRWDLPPDRVSTWHVAAATCIEMCSGCRQCRYLSLSIRHRDCSWYAQCQCLTGLWGVHSAPLTAARMTTSTNLTFLWLGTDTSTDAGTGAGNPQMGMYEVDHMLDAPSAFTERRHGVYLGGWRPQASLALTLESNAHVP